MALIEKIKEDVKTAMKSGDKERLAVLRFTLAGIQNAEKEKSAKQPGAALTDEETVALLQKEAKRRKESIELFRRGKRDDLVKKEEAELAIVQAYMPQGLSEGELENMVTELRGQGFNDFNSLMRETMKLVKGRADGKMVGDIVKKQLG